MATEDIKIFKAEETQDAPFPGQDGEAIVGAPSGQGQVYTPTVTKDKGFPKKRTAVELLSTSLNTKSKKIMAEFEFTESGALQIGKYENGVSGDVRISPNGMTARNQSGNTTFALDGDTGDAVFAGEIRSGSVVTGEVAVGNNRLILTVDENGEPMIVLYDHAGLARVLIGYGDF